MQLCKLSKESRGSPKKGGRKRTQMTKKRIKYDVKTVELLTKSIYKCYDTIAELFRCLLNNELANKTKLAVERFRKIPTLLLIENI